MEHIAVVTTVSALSVARSMARALIERKLAACAHLSEIESFYRWKGAVQNEREFRVLFKTTSERYQAVETAIRELHSYELPRGSRPTPPASRSVERALLAVRHVNSAPLKVVTLLWSDR